MTESTSPRNWPTVEMAVSDLAAAAWPENPRVISKAARGRLRASLEEFGLAGTVVFNRRTGRLVSGHQRISLLAETNVDKVAVTLVDLPEDQEKALNVTLNRADIGGDWDHEALDRLLDDLNSGSRELLESLSLDDMPEFKTADPDALLEKILSETEYVPQASDLDPADVAERLAAKIRRLSPAALRSALLVAVPLDGKELLILVDPDHADFVAEIQRAHANGLGPLERLFAAIV